MVEIHLFLFQHHVNTVLMYVCICYHVLKNQNHSIAWNYLPSDTFSKTCVTFSDCRMCSFKYFVKIPVLFPPSWTSKASASSHLHRLTKEMLFKFRIYFCFLSVHSFVFVACWLKKLFSGHKPKIIVLPLLNLVVGFSICFCQIFLKIKFKSTYVA